MTKKKLRPHSVDLSMGGMTDTSFGPSCDVNNIVRHYEQTGIDPFQSRKQLERYGDASTLSYEDAMRNKADYDSFNLENPNFIEELTRASAAPQGDNSADPSLPPAKPEAQPTDAVGVAKPAPQDASNGEL